MVIDKKLRLIQQLRSSGILSDKEVVDVTPGHEEIGIIKDKQS